VVAHKTEKNVQKKLRQGKAVTIDGNNLYGTQDAVRAFLHELVVKLAEGLTDKEKEAEVEKAADQL
jgi:hypothetical protein